MTRDGHGMVVRRRGGNGSSVDRGDPPGGCNPAGARSQDSSPDVGARMKATPGAHTAQRVDGAATTRALRRARSGPSLANLGHPRGETGGGGEAAAEAGSGTGSAAGRG